MSVNITTNRVNYAGYAPKREESYYGSSAPTQVTGYTPGDTFYVTSNGLSTGTITAVYRYDGDNLKWIKFPGGASSITPKLAPVISAINTPPTILNDQARYIITATATGAWVGKEGQIAEWDASNTTWVYYTPANLDQTTITTGSAAGVYQYDSTSKTWVQIKQGIDLVPLPDQPEAGRFRLTSEKQLAYSPNASWSVIANDAVATWGNDSMLNTGDGTNSSTSVRKLSANWMNGTDTAYIQGATYYPKFVDAVYSVNGGHVIGLDSAGKVWAMGSNNTSTGLTTTASGTTLMSRQPIYGFAPIPYFQTGAGASVKIAKIYTMTDKSNSVANVTNFALAIDGTVHCVGTNNFGQLGIGTTANRIQWATHPINQVKYLYMTWAGVALLQRNGNLHFSGSDAATMSGTSGAKTFPVLTLTGVDTSSKDSVCFLDRSGISAYAVKTDGTLWVCGANAQGQLARGNTTAQAGFAQVTGVNDAWKVFAPMAAVSNWFCLLRKDGSISFAGSNTNGIFGYGTVGTNYNTLITPNAAFQGTVVDVIPNGQNCYIITTEGTVWVSGNLDHAGVGVNGLGNNRWVQMSFPEPVLGLRTMYSNASTSNAMALTASHKVYTWGNFAVANQWNTSTSAIYAPTLIPIEFVDNSIGLATAQEYVADKVANVTFGNIINVTDIYDNLSNQNVTFTVSYNATAKGMLNLSLSSITGLNITSSFTSTTTLAINNLGLGTLTISATINALDDLTLAAPNSKTQNYTIVLNGTSISGNGLRVADDIVSSLSSSISSYISAPIGNLVPITGSEYNAIATRLTASRTAVSETGFSSFTLGNWPGVLRNTNHGIYGSSTINGYVVAMKVMHTAVNTSVTTGIQVGYGTAALTAGVAVSNLTTTTSTSDASGFLYWVIKSPYGISPNGALPTKFVTSQVGRYSNTLPGTTQNVLQTNGSGTPPVGQNVTNAPNALNAPGLSAFQFLQTPVKQWQ